MGAKAETSYRAVEHDPRLHARLLRQFDGGVKMLRGLLLKRFGEHDLDALIGATRAEYERVINRLPWIGGAANPRSFSLYGSALWLALWRALQPRGLTLEEAPGFFCALFRAYWSRYPRFLRHLYGRTRMSARHQRRLRTLARISRERINPHDYVYDFIPGEPGRFEFGIDFVECAILKFLRAEGAPELGPGLCELDWPHAELIGVDLMRTTTLAQGAARCDFRFRRSGPK